MSKCCVDISCTISVALLARDVQQIITDSSREAQENDRFRKKCPHKQHFREKQINVQHAISVRETGDSFIIAYSTWLHTVPRGF